MGVCLRRLLPFEECTSPVATSRTSVSCLAADAVPLTYADADLPTAPAAVTPRRPESSGE